MYSFYDALTNLTLIIAILIIFNKFYYTYCVINNTLFPLYIKISKLLEKNKKSQKEREIQKH